MVQDLKRRHSDLDPRMLSEMAQNRPGINEWKKEQRNSTKNLKGIG